MLRSVAVCFVVFLSLAGCCGVLRGVSEFCGVFLSVVVCFFAFCVSYCFVVLMECCGVLRSVS